MFVRCTEAAKPHRIIAFPYAGGGASAFIRAQGAFKNTELVAVQLPGREQRQAETLLDDAEQVLSLCERSIESLIQAPYALFGHSLGARLAFHLAQRIVERAMRPPSLLILSSCAAPADAGQAAATRPVHELSQAEFLRKMEIYSALPQELDAQQTAMLLPKLRADMKLLHDCTRFNIKSIAVPFLVLGGRNDAAVLRKDIERWQRFTTARSACRFFPGGHFYFFEAPNIVAPVIESHLDLAA